MTECPFLRYNFDHIDTRVGDYYIASTAWYPISIVTIYLLLIRKILPKFMESRSPYNLRKVIIAYNIVVIILNIVLIVAGLPSFWERNEWICSIVDYSDSTLGRRELFLTYSYYILKIVDLFDTVFFILKKNYRQVTYLHVYHHAGMVIFSWFMLRYVGGGATMWCGLFNCIVHTLMYSYYLATAYDRRLKNMTIIKKTITQLQLIQFVILLCIYGNLIYSGCPYPKIMSLFLFINAIYFTYLFGKFYIKTYIRNKNTAEVIRNKES